jgi:ligand-binding sensor domain-containing protein
MMRHLTILLLLITLVLVTCQKPLSSTASKLPINVEIQDSLTRLGSNIMAIYQDSKKVYWFGSWKSGLYRWDGKSITHFTTKDGLAHDRIDEIREDKYGNLYFNSCFVDGGVTKYDGKKFTQLTSVFSNQWILRSDDIWLKCSYGQNNVYRYDGDILHELIVPKPPKINHSFEIYSIYKDSKGHIWFGTNPSGVCRYDGQSFKWITEDDVTELHHGPANGVRSITEDKNGEMWFNTNYRYRIKEKRSSSDSMFYQRIPSIGSLDGHKSNNLTEYLSITKDHKDHLWIATYLNGVWQYDGNTITYYPIKNNGKDITVYCIYIDRDQKIWLGTHENGAYVLDGKEFKRWKPK